MSILITSIIGIICYGWGIFGIPWKHVKTLGEILYIIPVLAIVYNFICIIMIKCYRRNNTIYTSNHSKVKCSMIIVCVVNILALIFIIIAEILIGRNFRSANRNSMTGRVISTGDQIASFVGTSLIEIIICLLSYFWSMLHRLISLKIEGPYFSYMKNKLEKDFNQNSNTTNAYVVGNANNPNNLVLVGYDKDGRPLYSQQSQQEPTKPGVYNI